jgi:hypothetical protein
MTVLFCGATTGLALPAMADTVHATVTYVSATAVYVNVGRLNGIEPGNTGEVRRQGRPVAHLVVVFSADHSTSCRIADKTEDILRGDSAFVYVPARLPLANSDSSSSLPKSPPVAFHSAPPKSPPRNQLTARLALQTFLIHDRNTADRDEHEPAAILNGSIRNIGGSHLTFMLRSQSRRMKLHSAQNGAVRQRWDHRVFEMALVYDNPGSRVYLSMGRLLAGEISGMGQIDGLMVTYGSRNGLRGGLFYGTSPNPQTSSVHSNLTKAGILGIYRATIGTQQISSTVALTGEYHLGSISREFAYLQTQWNVSRFFSIYENAEVNIYRGWRRDAEGKSVELTNVVLNAVWSPVRKLTMTFGYDARSNYRTYESRSQPDSLFDTRLWQGARASADVQLPWGMSAGMSAGLRKREGDPETMRNASIQYSLNNPLGSQMVFLARENLFQNAMTSGEQPSIGISRRCFSRVFLTARVGQDRYQRRITNASSVIRWLQMNLDVDVTRLAYASAYGEYYRGGGQNTDRYLLEIGFRY